MNLRLYRAFMYLARPFARPLLELRRGKGLESDDPKRRLERLGAPSAPRPDGTVFWFDALSVGEGNSAMPVIARALEKYPASHAIVTTTTVTGAENMRKHLAGRRAIHQFLPLDRRAYVDRFLDHWRPSAGFFVDSNFWPNMLLASRARNIPLILLNGRISDTSYARWTRNREDAKMLMRSFVYALAKSDDDAKKLSDMGIANVDCVGNLKYGMPPVAHDEGILRELRSAGARKNWTASVTHEGEEEIILAAHKKILGQFPGALLIISPRHAERGLRIRDMAAGMGFDTALESEAGTTFDGADVYISDSFGNLGLYYAYTDIVFVGGSLLPSLRGHNPMESARLGCAVLSGPYVDSFLETYDILRREDAVITVGNAEDLAEHVASLMSSPEKLAELTDMTRLIAEREAGVINRAWERISPLLERIVPPTESTS
ncbi:MAG: 3-deoxy-D-manno-octulosonic acid transferase [Synergistaceae bacterium]|jgi:3-deoxy-D-manno-octulosonic-acid transferase|nr:3-deoxy-D-manno-octulosonic acid transferase [Synergistaceae bacterium]